MKTKNLKNCASISQWLEKLLSPLLAVAGYLHLDRRQVGQVLFALDTLDRRKPQEICCNALCLLVADFVAKVLGGFSER